MVVYRKINDVEFGVDIAKASGLLCTKDVAEQIDGNIYEFIDYLYEQDKIYTPLIATWEITNCCNFKCPFCYINTDKKPDSVVWSFEAMKQHIDDLVDEGLLLVYLTGGEVLSVPDFEKIYRYLKEKGVFVVLLTNLSLLDDRHIKLFTELPPFRITASIYGMSERQFSSVTGKDYSCCQKILDNILTIKKLGINITCQMPVNSCTVHDLTEIGNWCYSNGIRFTFNNELTDSYYDESRSEYFIDDESFSKLKQQIKTIEPEKSSNTVAVKKEFGYKRHFDCVSGRHTFAVSYDGHLRPCFNIFECDSASFDGSGSMKYAVNKMKDYIENKKKEVILGCHGCEAVHICGECIYTRNKHKDNLNEYISSKCAENKKKICELI